MGYSAGIGFIAAAIAAAVLYSSDLKEVESLTSPADSAVEIPAPKYEKPLDDLTPDKGTETKPVERSEDGIPVGPSYSMDDLVVDSLRGSQDELTRLAFQNHGSGYDNIENSGPLFLGRSKDDPDQFAIFAAYSGAKLVMYDDKGDVVLTKKALDTRELTDMLDDFTEVPEAVKTTVADVLSR